MRRIIVGAMVSIDGVMQAPGGPTEDPTKGFKLGGWVMPYFDREFGEELDHVFAKFDLLLGRKTYEIFAGYWPYYDEDAPNGDIAKRFKDIKKYAVSRSGEVDTSWAGSVLLRDIAEVKRLKQEEARTSSPRAVPNWSTLCSPTTWSTPSASSRCRSCLAAARSCSPTARRRIRSS
jgi:dihydrofolate reductase